MKTIIVHMSDEAWTLEAMHLASALARNINGKIVLLRLVLANNPGLLGWGVAPPTTVEQRQIKDYAAVAEDYGVEFWVQPMQFITLEGALVQAAAALDATFLFAHIAHRQVSWWRRFRVWNLKRQLHNCCLYTLYEDQPLSVNVPMSPAEWEQQHDHAEVASTMSYKS
ncbi:MAG: hypothetical protein L0154_05645 [Chloroflexi bacterium]|nr:hypothetical protein [Chloroflexota bacterium]